MGRPVGPAWVADSKDCLHIHGSNGSSASKPGQITAVISNFNGQVQVRTPPVLGRSRNPLEMGPGELVTNTLPAF